MNYSENDLKGGNNFNPFIPLFIVIFFAVYIFSLLFGDNSISAYLNTKARKEALLEEYNRLQRENQKLQRRYFELIQLTPDIDVF